MTLHKITAEIDEFDAPWGKKIKLRQVEYEGGSAMLQVQIREGRRITILDLDRAAAARWGDAMTAWANAEKARTKPR